MISIVIPAYNEEKRILPTLEACISGFSQQIELIIVLNGCSDNTSSVTRSFIKKHPGVAKMIEIPEAIGKGGAIRKGFQEAQGEIIGFLDADLATPIQDVKNLIQKIEENKCDASIASRLLPGSKVIGRGILRSIVSRVYASIARFLFDFDYADTQCGAKFMSRSACKKILQDLSMNNMTIDVDILLALRKHSYRVEEVPTTWFDRSSSAMLGSPLGVLTNGTKMFFSLLTLQRKYERV